MEGEYKFKPGSMVLKNTIIKLFLIGCIGFLLLNINKNPQGVSILIAILIVLYSSLKTQKIELDFLELKFIENQFFGLNKSVFTLEMSSIKQVSIYKHNGTLLGDAVELYRTVTFRNNGNALVFDLKEGKQVAFQTRFTQIELEEILKK